MPNGTIAVESLSTIPFVLGTADDPNLAAYSFENPCPAPTPKPTPTPEPTPYPTTAEPTDAPTESPVKVSQLIRLFFCLLRMMLFSC